MSDEMCDPRNSLTIRCGDDCFTIVGHQIHSKAVVSMTCKHRGDGKCAIFHFQGQSINATVKNLVTEDVRGLTAVGNDEVRIEQIEHILSALSGMGYLDTDIYLDYVDEQDKDRVVAPPVAFLSALDFTSAIARSFHSSPSDSRVRIDQRYTVRADADDDDSALAVFTPHSEFYVTVSINYRSFLGKQVYSCNVDPGTYAQRISWARSFFSTPYPHKGEIEKLKEQYPGQISGDPEHYRSMMLDYDYDDWITPPYSEDEPARHKLLDVIGDLALLGAPLEGAVFVYKPYHKFNRRCARRLYQNLGLGA